MWLDVEPQEPAPASVVDDLDSTFDLSLDDLLQNITRRSLHPVLLSPSAVELDEFLPSEDHLKF